MKEPDWSPIRLEGLRIGVIADVHIPYHDAAALELAVSYLKDCGIDQLVILGDWMDFYSISRFDKERPLNNDLSVEITAGREGLEWVRECFPDIPIKWKEGNHDDRLKRFIRKKVPELSNLGVLTTSHVFGLDKLSIDFITPDRHLFVHEMALVHGHEVMRSGGRNPAQRLFDKTRCSAMCGHFHRTDEYWHRSMDDTFERTYTLGALCSLTPEYDRHHNWNHGFALIETTPNTYHVQNMRIIDGDIY
jgi:predicted phosphodiesterase